MKPFEVTYFTRKPLPGQVSIERVFKTVSEAMPSEVFQRFFEMPHPSKGIKAAAANVWASKSKQSNINHITGDVHYLAAGLDPRRTVLTIHDFVSLHRLRGFKRSLFYWLWYAIPASRAAAITVPSTWTVQELRKWLPRNRKPVHVVPNPLPSAFQYDPKPFNSERPTLLHIGTKPNKNLERTAEAVAGIACKLKVVGALSDTQRKRLSDLQIDFDNVSNLTDAEMVEAYRQADAVLFASTYEGFGLPVIEANGIGRPVITSDLSPMREIGSNAAQLVDPHDPASIRKGVLEIIENESRREELVHAGIENAKAYRPEHVASEYLSIYRSVLERAA